MDRVKRWLGVDVSKAELVVAYRRAGKLVVLRVANTAGGFRRLLKSSSHWDMVCFEPTGPYWKRLAAWLDERGIPWALANPREVRDFAKAMGHRSKTDPIDAGVLVRFAETRDLKPRRLADPVLEKICRISRLCQSLQEDLTRNLDRIEKAQADPFTPAIVTATLEELTQGIAEQIRRLEAEVLALIKTDDQLDRDYRLLRSIKSVGPKTARVLIAEIGDGLRWATASQLVSFAGLDVVLTESGKSTLKRPRISKKGNWRVRRALYLAALSAIVHNPILAPYYRRLVARNVPRKAALVAVMRKLLHLCHGVIKHQKPFDPSFGVRTVGEHAMG